MNIVGILLATILSSGVIAALVSSSLSDAKERRVLQRQKIEEIYLSASAWLRHAQSSFITYLRVSEGALSYNQALDIEIAGAKDIAGEQHLRMKMNIEMYERSLLPTLRRMEGELEKLVTLRSALRDCYEETGQATEFKDVYRQQLLRFGKASDDLEAAIIARGVIIGQDIGMITRWLFGVLPGRFRSDALNSAAAAPPAPPPSPATRG